MYLCLSRTCVIALPLYTWPCIISVMIHFVPEILGQCNLQCFALAAELMRIMVQGFQILIM